MSGTWCCQLELSTAVPALAGVMPRRPDQDVARVLVRLHGEPLGYLHVTDAEADDAEGVRATALTHFAPRITDHLHAEGASDVVGAPTPTCPNAVEAAEVVTVIVCTRDRPTVLAGCLAALGRLRYPQLDIVIVDNAPTSAATRDLVMSVAATDPRFRYVVELRPGLSRARNHGLAVARGRFVAYTDDDVEVDPGWIDGVVHGFARRADIGAVTGLVCSASIDTPAESYFDARAASWSSRCEAEVFDLGSRGWGRLYPYSAGIFGTGANLAFDREALVALGGFDETLGAGTPTRGGEDLDIFVRVLRSGAALAYEPAAIVWHHHRADDAALKRQLYGYGTGLGAFLTKLLLSRDTRLEVLRRIPVGAARATHIPAETAHRLEAPMSPPRGATAREVMGWLAGPFTYARSRAARRAGR